MRNDLFVVLVQKIAGLRVPLKICRKGRHHIVELFPLLSGLLVSSRESKASLSLAPVILEQILTILFHTERAHKYTEIALKEVFNKK